MERALGLAVQLGSGGGGRGVVGQPVAIRVTEPFHGFDLYLEDDCSHAETNGLRWGIY